MCLAAISPSHSNIMVETNESRDDVSGSQTETHHVQYDPTSDLQASELLIATVADIGDTAPLELEPLYETVDTDMLDELVRSDSYPDVSGHISFVFGGYSVRVHASGLLEIEVGD